MQYTRYLKLNITYRLQALTTCVRQNRPTDPAVCSVLYYPNSLSSHPNWTLGHTTSLSTMSPPRPAIVSPPLVIVTSQFPATLTAILQGHTCTRTSAIARVRTCTGTTEQVAETARTCAWESGGGHCRRRGAGRCSVASTSALGQHAHSKMGNRNNNIIIFRGGYIPSRYLDHSLMYLAYLYIIVTNIKRWFKHRENNLIF
jgi:hypothetical protein